LCFRYFGFDNFRVKVGKGENTRKFEFQVFLRHGKGDMSIKEKIHRTLKPKGDATKMERSDFSCVDLI
jgi:hypothetical protein